MTTWKVIYQRTPYNYTSPSTLVIEAESREAALVTAYDHLTRRGHSISIDSVSYDLNAISPHIEPTMDWSLAKSLGWPAGPTRGDTHILSITPHMLTACGKVVAV